MGGLPAGTRVHKRGNPARKGTVMPHEPKYSGDHFPVRLDDGVWEILNASHITVLGGP